MGACSVSIMKCESLVDPLLINLLISNLYIVALNSTHDIEI